MNSIKIERASWVLTLDSKRHIIKDGSVYIEDGKIAAVDKAHRLKSESADTIIDGLNRVVTPGFINNHMHVSYAHPVRGIFPDELPLQTKHEFISNISPEAIIKRVQPRDRNTHNNNHSRTDEDKRNVNNCFKPDH